MSKTVEHRPVRRTGRFSALLKTCQQRFPSSPFPQNREKIQGILGLRPQIPKILPKICKFRFELRKGTGKEQESEKNRPNLMLLQELIETGMTGSGKEQERNREAYFSTDLGVPLRLASDQC